jgi:glycosyltransferase involved in cell wall biosynthesis
MRIVIDMQGAQTESRFRGIGRYNLGFARGVVRNRGKHDIILALSSLFPDTIEPIRAAFDGLLPQENIRVWYAPGPVLESAPGNDARREAAELIREAFLASLQPDVIHIGSLFEGYVDDAVTSIGKFDQNTPVSVALYDLIPFLNPDLYLKPNPSFAKYYERKIQFLKQAKAYIAISDFTRSEALHHLNLPDASVVNVSTAIEDAFARQQIGYKLANETKAKFGLTKPFVLYTGGADERKNLPRLIQAYAALPAVVRAEHQLVFTGKMPDGNIAQFKKLAKTAGLKSHELFFINHVSDKELVQLYNLCTLYVFPSWHEGFGLPALEAMACGAVVIGANTSSLPEVIGNNDALFDPFDVTAITAKMQQALTDEGFREDLLARAKEQVKTFSWDSTAKRAFLAWESIPSAVKPDYFSQSMAETKLYASLAPHATLLPAQDRLVLVSSIALNQQAGIERQILVDVSELCQRDAATGVQRVVRGYLRWLLQSPPAGFRIEPVYATRERGYHYAREYTQYFLGHEKLLSADEPIRWQRGDLFFGLDMQHHIQLAQQSFYQQLRQDGVTVKFLIYDLLPIQLPDLFKDYGASELHADWLSMVAEMDGAISISKATADAYHDWLSNSSIRQAKNFQNDWVHIGADIDGSRPSTGLPKDASAILKSIQSSPAFLTVSTLEPRKGQQQVLEAFEQLWKEGQDLNLVFVGQQGWKVEALTKQIEGHTEFGKRLFWLKGISDEYLEQIYGASTCLIAASLNEGFGLPLIEAARHGIPIIARDIPVFREVAGDSAYYFSDLNADVLAKALKDWLVLFRAGQQPNVRRMRWSTWQQSSEKLKTALVAQHYPRRQLLVDISELVQRDAKTGIQRVVRNVLREWLSNPPEGWRIEPVYATVEQPYRYAREFTAQFLGSVIDDVIDEPVDYAPGDVFFGLDLQPQVQVAHADFYQKLRRHGVVVKFLVHDLLCIQQPESFGEGAADGFSSWLGVVAESDGAICVSRAVAQELGEWMKSRSWKRLRSFSLNWSHNGVEIKKIQSIGVLSSNVTSVFDRIQSKLSFLMVGTLEPRKGHAQVLDAFEQLWREGLAVNLVIVGKQGWLADELVARLRSHSELNNRLSWLEAINDEYLEAVYAGSTCLIAASYGEGFGLPLIEAAQHKLPIIARDIHVFREVAGEHAYYFSAQTPNDLAHAIGDWLSLFKKQQHPSSNDMPWMTWKESASTLFKRLGISSNQLQSRVSN